MLNWIAWVSLAAGVGSGLLVAFDPARGHRQHMWIMNLVWPLTAIWSGPFGLWAYFRYGRAGEERAVARAKQKGEPPPNRQQLFAVLAGKGTSHCGSGCLLGDIAAELLILAIPIKVFGHQIFGAWLYDLLLAYAFGIAFQYFAIEPMSELSTRTALGKAIKADTLSLLAWQIGMFGWMALATFGLFHRELDKANPVFWMMMQVAMFWGFATSYPVNRWLLRRGIKERCDWMRSARCRWRAANAPRLRRKAAPRGSEPNHSPCSCSCNQMERSLIGVAAPARRTVHGRFNAARVPVPIPR